MLRLIARRVLLMLATAIVVSELLFFTVTQLLGSPAEMMLGQDASPRAIAALNAAYGFDRPSLAQYLHWLGGALTGDLGRSYTTQQSVAAAIVACVAGDAGANALVDRIGGDRGGGEQHDSRGTQTSAVPCYRGEPHWHHGAKGRAQREAVSGKPTATVVAS
jgi:hypothetical protein